MKVRLVDVDGIMPIIPLMQVSKYHKKLGDDVDWHNPMMDEEEKPDLVYASKLFDFSDDYLYFPDCKIIKGGTGYDIYSKLPPEIERITKLDYSIYPKCDYSIQFFSRGCIKERKCPFCVVKRKEGLIHPVEPYKLNPRGKHIEVFDNSFFGNPEWKSAAEQLIAWEQPVNLHGVDARIMTEEHAWYLNKMKHYKQIHIAWDDPRVDLTETLQQITKYIKPYKLMCYVLIGFWSTPEEDLYRVEKLRELGIDPFVMPFDKKNKYQKKFARWVNHKAIFKTVKWQDYRAS
ncbi:hypothetical protein [Ruminiclostridium josui]|uniref:hypothetical protein n=1 Tax=Ruminiclostridium josui TaxID=1499 RepID=UPI00046592F8|nr:hypothetical protein [Ruminiclostridium josui]